MLASVSQVARRVVRVSSHAPALTLRFGVPKSSSELPVGPLSNIYGRQISKIQIRSLYQSIALRDLSNDASEESKTETKEGPQDLDFSVLQPKPGESAPVSKTKVHVDRVFTKAQSERCAKTMAKWRAKVQAGLNEEKDLVRANASLISASAKGDDVEVLDLWVNSVQWGYPPSVPAFNCVFIALERMEDQKKFPPLTSSLISSSSTTTPKSRNTPRQDATT